MVPKDLHDGLEQSWRQLIHECLDLELIGAGILLDEMEITVCTGILAESRQHLADAPVHGAPLVFAFGCLGHRRWQAT